MGSYYEIHIPHCYVWMTKDIPNRVDRVAQFNRYVKGYLAKVHPDMQLVKISKMIAICEKREDERGRVD